MSQQNKLEIEHCSWYLKIYLEIQSCHRNNIYFVFIGRRTLFTVLHGRDCILQRLCLLVGLYYNTH